jgi:hypothetical protein
VSLRATVKIRVVAGNCEAKASDVIAAKAAVQNPRAVCDAQKFSGFFTGPCDMVGRDGAEKEKNPESAFVSLWDYLYSGAEPCP